MRPLLYCLILLLLTSCFKPTPTKIVFEGKAFYLPIYVKTAEKFLDLNYCYYVGFFTGFPEYKKILIQLEDKPAFDGSDNDNAEDYYDDLVVGVTFFVDKERIKAIQSELEAQFGEKFKITVINKKRVKLIQTLNGLFIVLHIVERKPQKELVLAISFYQGIEKGELKDFLKYVR